MSTVGYDDKHHIHTRLIGFRVIAIIAFAVLAVAFWILQVVQYSKYQEMADNNYLRTIPLRAPRGVLFDRNGRVLVENQDSFTIALVRERTANLDRAIRTLAAAVGYDEARVRQIVQKHRTDPGFRPIPIVEHASFAQVASVKARKLELPEVEVLQVPARAYPDGGMGAHLFGYVSEIQESQLDKPEYVGLDAGAIVGQAGIEKIYNASLMGTDGKKNVVVNSVGREIEALGQESPVEGKRLQLTIDYDLQHALEEAFHENNIAGGGIFLNPRNGEILALTSLPAYDPNDFTGGIEGSRWVELNRDALKPLQNRLLSGRYSPGSTFKIVMAIAALSEGIITPETTFYCPGHQVFYGRDFKCDKRTGHGVLNLRQAIEQSCDVYFYNVGQRMNIDTIHDYAERLGLTGLTGVDLPGEIASIIPSTEWKRKARNEPWYPGETISVAIGQGPLSVTPIAQAVMISAIANGGTHVTPHVVKAIDEDGRGWQPVTAPAPRSILPLKPDALQAVHDGLWMVVNGAGTGYRAKMAGYDISGKTGTAQVISLEGAKIAKGIDTRDHAWFVFFAPRDNPEIAGVVFAEHAGFGGQAAAPITRYVLETYYAKKEGRPLPPWTKDYLIATTVAPPPVPSPAPGRAPGGGANR